MGLFSNLLGTYLNNLHIGGRLGPQFKNSTGVLSARNSADSDYALFRVADAVTDKDAVNLLTLATYNAKPLPASLQISGASAAPSNSTSVQWYVVTTSGGTASIGQLYYDNGSNAGTCDLFSAQPFGTIFTPNALSGGTISFAAGSHYYWDGAAWVLQSSPSSGTTIISIPITTAASTSSTAEIPSGAIVYQAMLNVKTGYSPGTTIKIGISGTLNAFMETSQNIPAGVGLYPLTQYTAVGSSSSVVATIGGSPATGSADVVVFYAIALS